LAVKYTIANNVERVHKYIDAAQLVGEVIEGGGGHAASAIW
jgi:hypothetical protein